MSPNEVLIWFFRMNGRIYSGADIVTLRIGEFCSQFKIDKDCKDIVTECLVPCILAIQAKINVSV